MGCSDLQIRKVVPLQDGPGWLIKVSRNVQGMMKGMTTPQINAIVGIADALQRELFYGDALPSCAFSELVVPVPYNIVGSCHERSRLQEELEKLMAVKIRYCRPVPGSQVDVTSSIVSAVIRQDGKFFLTVPPTALPFYLFCGKTVGFTSVERDILLKLPSYNQKLLHLLMCDKIDSKTKVGELVISPADLIFGLGLGESYKTSALIKNILEPYAKNINNSNSSMIVEISKVTESSGRQGHPRITGLRISAKPKINAENKSKQFEVVYNFLTNILKSLDAPLMNAAQITGLLESRGELELFTNKIKRFLDKERGAGKENRRHTANAVRKILKNDFCISV